jgi:glycosyltransferase involved in cell wall biosynthesis
MARVAILWQGFPEYVSKCVQTLARKENVEILLLCQGEDPFPNVSDQTEKYPNVQILEGTDPQVALETCVAFKPQMAVVPLTRRGLFAEVASAWRKAGTLVIAVCDLFWTGTWRNFANLMASKLGWFSPYEAIMVPGTLGKMYARRMGFAEQVIFDGMYTCDTEIFQPIGQKRHADGASTDWPRVFLFVGQYIHRKGFDILLKAYQVYRQQASRPWELWLVGRGDLERDIGMAPGVRNLGMKSSTEIAQIMLQAGCLVLPSRLDHWGVVVHEAASAGLPILASSMCGASAELVETGFNGYVFPPNNATVLTRLLLFMDVGGLAQKMGGNSLHLSCRFNPQLWARRILVDIPLFLRGQTFAG